tara:strand:- start:386 stop:592 length:207 start_codon:yes stop_codon:yes gene_type:complete
MKDKNFIKKMNLKKGAFTKQSKKAKMTVPEFTKEVINNPTKYSSTTKKRAVLARTFDDMRRGRGKGVH